VEASNPYAPPESELQAFIDPAVVWRNEKLIVMRKGGDLPGRCILCNEIAEPGKPRRIIYLNIWLQIAMLVLFLVFNVLALIPIIIVSLIFRKTAKVGIPVCGEHRRKRLWITLTTFSLLAASSHVPGSDLHDCRGNFCWRVRARDHKRPTAEGEKNRQGNRDPKRCEITVPGFTSCLSGSLIHPFVVLGYLD